MDCTSGTRRSQVARGMVRTTSNHSMVNTIESGSPWVRLLNSWPAPGNSRKAVTIERPMTRERSRPTATGTSRIRPHDRYQG